MRRPGSSRLAICLAMSVAAFALPSADAQCCPPEIVRDWTVAVGDGSYGVRQFGDPRSGYTYTTLNWQNEYAISPVSAPVLASVAAGLPASLFALGALGFAWGKRGELRAERRTAPGGLRR